MRGASETTATIRPARTKYAARGESSCGRERSALRNATNKYKPMAMSKKPPSGRTRMAAPTARPQPIQRQYSKKYFQSFAKSRRRVICQKRANRCQQERQFCCAGRTQPPGKIGGKKTGADIDKHLYKENRPVVVHAKDCE